VVGTSPCSESSRVALADLGRIADDAATAVPTYQDVGATLSSEPMPPGFRHDRYEVILGGADGGAFERGCRGLREWAAHVGAGFVVEPDQPPSEGATVAVAAPLGPLTAVAVCRIVSVVDEPDRYGFAYGTLPGHPERGEEAFVVERAGDGGALFRIIAFSRPSELLARLGGPVTRALQQRATRRYLTALADFVVASE
jgi:uncharacterized protein (UPF0548 family)